MFNQFQNISQNNYSRFMLPTTNVPPKQHQLIVPKPDYSKLNIQPQKTMSPMLNEFIKKNEDSSKLLINYPPAKPFLHFSSTLNSKSYDFHFKKNLHFKNPKFMKKNRFLKNPNENIFQSSNRPLIGYPTSKNALDLLSTIHEKEELNFETNLKSKLSQKLGYGEVLPTDQYFSQPPVQNYVNSPMYQYVPQVHLYNRGLVPIQQPAFISNNQTFLKKREYERFNAMNSMPSIGNKSHKLMFRQNQNNLNSYNVRKSRPRINTIFLKDLFQGKSFQEMAKIQPKEICTFPSAKAQETQSQMTQEPVETDQSASKEKIVKPETPRNVILQEKDFGLTNILKNSFLKKSISESQKNQIMKSVQRVLLLNSYNQRVQINADNVFLMINMQMKVSQPEFLKIHAKYRLRIVSLLFVKYVNRSAFAKVCKDFMEELDFKSESGMLKNLKR